MTTTPIYHGIWADKLENNQELSIGGSRFGGGLTQKLVLDFETFIPDLTNFHTPDALNIAYKESKDALQTWLTQVGSMVDPYLFFVATNVQNKTQSLLPIDPTRSVIETEIEHARRFPNDIARLSELKDVAVCGERSALGQYLLQHTLQEGYDSAYMGGVVSRLDDADNISNHSFLVMRTPSSDTYIFDIARPRSQHNLPRVLRTDVPFTAEMFIPDKGVILRTKEVLQGEQVYYGSADPMSYATPRVLTSHK